MYYNIIYRLVWQLVMLIVFRKLLLRTELHYRWQLLVWYLLAKNLMIVDNLTELALHARSSIYLSLIMWIGLQTW